MAKQSYKITIKGPGHNFARNIDEAAVRSILNFVMAGSGDASGAPAGILGGNALALTGGMNQGAGGGGVGGVMAGQGPKQFIASKRPGSENERVACIAYFLANARQQHTFKNKDIVDLNTEAAQHKLSNAPRTINDTASKNRYLASAGHGQTRITVLGESIVEALPDRAAVKAILADQKGTGRKRRVSKKKPKAAK